MLRRRAKPNMLPAPPSSIQMAAGSGTGVVANSAIANDSLPAESAALIVTDVKAGAPADNAKSPEG